MLLDDLRDLIRSNEQAFREGLIKVLQINARVTVLRLFDIQVDWFFLKLFSIIV